uniref:Uncharacterized protein n=1 Tax=Seriola dumerili TaxID=41447 RepID=A0A3B4V2P2_SERDU
SSQQEECSLTKENAGSDQGHHVGSWRVSLTNLSVCLQSDRMEDQRCPLPDLDDVIGSVPEGQEDFFSLIQRVQSRRMDEQRHTSVLIFFKNRLPSDDPSGSWTSC